MCFERKIPNDDGGQVKFVYHHHVHTQTQQHTRPRRIEARDHSMLPQPGLTYDNKVSIASIDYDHRPLVEVVGNLISLIECLHSIPRREESTSATGKTLRSYRICLLW